MMSCRKLSMGMAVLGLLVGCGGGGTGPSSSNGGTAVVNTSETPSVQWNSLLLQSIRVTAIGPTAGSRAIAIVHTAGYDAWAAYNVKAYGTQLGSSLRRPSNEWTDANKRKAMSYAMYTALVALFPTQKGNFDTFMWKLGYNPFDSGAAGSPGDIGVTAAKALLAYRATDGSNQNGTIVPGAYKDWTGYTPANTVDKVNDIGRWQPLTFVFPDGSKKTPGFLTPQWGKVKTFAITDPATVRAPAPPAPGTALFKQRADEILDLTRNLSDREKMIAEYWAKGSGTEFPPGQWAGIGAFVSERDKNSVDDDAKMFFILGNALMDAGICCWETKVYYDYVRPITAIRELYRGKDIVSWGGPGRGVVTMKGEDYIPYQPASFITPPFAEYTSGHSTFSAASAEILKRFTGSDSLRQSVIFKPGSSEIEPGVTPQLPVTLYWDTFSDAAAEAGLSRRLGGIHFEDGDTYGRIMGRQIANLVWIKALSYINGTPSP